MHSAITAFSSSAYCK